MKASKRLLCLLLAVITCVGLLAGCKKSQAPDTTSATNPTEHPHSYGDWQTDSANHWKSCVCGEKSENAAHLDENADEVCDTCGYAVPVPEAPLVTAEQMKAVTAVKTASAGGAVTAHPGGRIAYKIAITNNNSVAISVNVTDTLPEGTLFVSGCDNVSGSTLSWKVKRIEPGKTVTLTYLASPNYTVQQVRESTDDIILKNTAAKVMDVAVAAPAKDIYVLETFNAGDIRKMEMAIDAMVTANLTAYNSSKQQFNQIPLANMMYYVGFTAGMGLGTTDPGEVLTMVFDKAGQTGSGTASGGVEDVVDTAMNLLDRVPPHLYGGTAIPASKDSQFRGERATSVTISDLISGDLIFVNKSGETKLYIVDGTKLVHLGKTEVVRQIDPSTVLPGLPAADKFVVIRPSINLNITFSLQEGEYFNDYDKGEYTDLEKALIATAETYLLRGDRIQYTDDMTGKSVYRAENTTKQPEDYTVDQYGYTNCAFFTYDVHWATYGYAAKAADQFDVIVNLSNTSNLASAASRGWNAETMTGSNKSTIFYYEPPKTTVDNKVVSALTDAEKEALKQQIYSLLRPGDLINIRRSTGSGHVMLYVGNGTIIHSSGSNYSSTNKTDTHEASIRFRMVADLFDPEIYNETSCVYNLVSFSITRPQNLTNPVISENTANRVANMQGVIAEKISSTAMGKTVNCGDEITYTFYIFNTNPEAKTFAVKDVLSEHVTFVSATNGGTCTGSDISWSITVPADTRVSVSYTVKVKDGVAAYTAIDGSKATINGVTHKCIDTYVANTLTADQQQKLINAVNTVKGMDISGMTGIQIINLIYKTAFGVDNIFGENVTTEAQLFNGDYTNNVGIFNDTTYWSNKAYVSVMDASTANAAKMVAPGLFGGQNVYNSSKAGETYFRYLNVGNKTLRSRYFWEKDLVVGDIFMLRGSSTMYLYIYVGNDTFVNLNGTKVFDTTSVSTRFQYAPANTWKYMAVLRPSMVLDI